MRCLKSVAALAAALVLSTLFGGRPAQADRRPRFRAIGPVFREPSPHYGRHYYGPVGTYGSPYYGLANRPYFYAPPVYGGYGYGSVVGYGYPPGYYAPIYGGPYAVSRTPGVAPFDPYSNPALQDTMLENELRWGLGLPQSPPSLRTRGAGETFDA